MTFPKQTLSSLCSSWRELRQRSISHFRAEQSESYSWPNLFEKKQEDHKTALLFLIPKSQRKAVFIANNAEDVLTQWIFILPPLFPLVKVQLFLGNTRARPCIQRSSNDINTVRLKQFLSRGSLLLPTGGFGIKKKYFSFSRLYP